jgi:hypothetical protein
MTETDKYNIVCHLIQESETKRKNATTNMVEIMKIELPDEIMRHISSFAFYDVNTKVYYEKRKADYYKSVMRSVIQNFTTCFFSRNIFHYWSGLCIIINEEDETKKTTIYSHVCNRCGNFCEESLFPRHFRTICKCASQYDDNADMYNDYFENVIKETYYDENNRYAY